MPHGDLPQPEKVMPLADGMALYRIHVELLAERDVNARVMAPDKFARLVENVKAAGGLESFPLARLKQHDGREVFEILSGHHRTRAARAAGLTVIPVIVVTAEISDDEATARQLAHNALAGHDDLQVLRSLYDSIGDPLAKLASGLTDLEVKVDIPAIATASLSFEFGFEPVYLLFMRDGLARFEEMVDRLDPEARIYAARHEDWDEFVETSRRIAKLRNVRNIGSIMTLLLEYAEKGIAADAP